ncbi:response regulator transcription factor LytR [Staphylococcus lutrae]|uniref:DNA-binding response regulator n=1 Tax=Staphylococcus lutrae TaxID=155085 RepID=A0AAC9RS14_9STAP|nr:response regulator transcription factor LytR [Staphylococcus lutrae]ARJ50666.1 DNA-binding response regulator [Staphylococcus lutrae]PNZ39114.1 DNA-binding response regulator [Staphylococcus lutrae]
MRALIVDDEPLARNELVFLLNRIGGFEVLDEAENVSETMEALLVNEYDLVFLDINLMDENGIELGKKIQKMKTPPAIVFATAHDQYAVQAFELNATDYIMKPFEQARVAQAVEKVHGQREKREERQGGHSDTRVTHPLPIEVGDRIQMLSPADVIGISVNQGVTTIYTIQGPFETSEPLSAYEKRLDRTDFIRIHRANLINRQHIEAIEHWFNSTYMVTLTDGVKLQVSRSYMKRFKQVMGLRS